MNQKAKRKISPGRVIVFVVVIVFLITAAIALALLRKYSTFTFPAPPLSTNSPQQESYQKQDLELESQSEPQDLSLEEREIIGQLETHVVIIGSQSLTPQDLTIKVHDQIEWQNQDAKPHQIAGEDWGDVVIEPGESFTQAFSQPGTYPYSCTPYPNLRGTVTVK